MRLHVYLYCWLLTTACCLVHVVGFWWWLGTELVSGWLVAIHTLSIGLPRVLEYSLLSISGWKFPFPVAVFAVNRWIVKFIGNLGLRDFFCPLASLEIDLRGAFRHWPFWPQVRPQVPTTRSSSLAACIKKYFPTSGISEYYSRKLLVSGSPSCHCRSLTCLQILVSVIWNVAF